MQRLRIVLGIALVSVAALFVAGCASNTNEEKYSLSKVAFSSVRQGDSFGDITFINGATALGIPGVRNVDVDEPKNITVQVDPSSSGTLLSASYKYSWNRYMAPSSSIGYGAASVVVYVQNDDQKKVWEAFLAQAQQHKDERDRYFDERRKAREEALLPQVTPTIVLPPSSSN